MESVIGGLLVFVLGCLVHLEVQVATLKTMIKKNNNTAKVGNTKRKGRKNQRGVNNHE